MSVSGCRGWKRESDYPGAVVPSSCAQLDVGAWELSSGSLQEQDLLLLTVESSPQPQECIFYS